MGPPQPRDTTTTTTTTTTTRYYYYYYYDYYYDYYYYDYYDHYYDYDYYDYELHLVRGARVERGVCLGQRCRIELDNLVAAAVCRRQVRGGGLCLGRVLAHVEERG